MASHTTTTGKVKVSYALSPDTQALLRGMATGPRGIGALLDELIRQEAARRGARHRADEQARQMLETLHAANTALTQSLDLDVVLERLLDYLAQLVPFDSANVMLFTADNTVAVRAARGYDRWTDSALTQQISFDIHSNVPIQDVVNHRRSLLVPDTTRYTGWERRPGAEHVLSWLAVPLIVRDTVLGLFSVDKTEPGYFTTEHVRLAEALAPQAAVAIQNARLYADVSAGREQLQRLSRRLVELQEQERRALSRELHDTSGQTITALKLGLGALKRAEGCSEAVRTRVDEMLDLADTVSEELHRLAVNLRPSSLDRYGLVPALEQLLIEFRKQTGLKVGFDAEGMAAGPARLPAEVEAALYRIVQEALTNISRHAHPQTVSVILENRDGQARLIVEDDGQGFDVEATRHSGRLGLLGMRERAEMLGGSFEIESSPTSGTCIYASIPLGQAEGGAPLAVDDSLGLATSVPAVEGAAVEPDAGLIEAAELARAKTLGDALLDIIAATAHCANDDEILPLVLARSAEAVGRDNAHIAQRGPDGWYLSDIYHDTGSRARIADIDAPAFSWVEKRHRVLVVDDTSRLEPGDPLRLEAHPVKSYACIPLLAGNTLLGVLSFVNYATAAAFHPSEVEFLNRLASFVALALENVQLHDAEARQRHELARRIEELQAVLDLLPVGIGIAYDPECRNISANPALSRMLGMPPEANASASARNEQGQPPYRVFQDGRELNANELPMQTAAASGREVRDVLNTIVRPDGTTLTLLSSAVPLFDAQGRPRGAVAGFADITERQLMTEALAEREAGLREALTQRRAAAQALAEEEERYRSLFNSMQEGFAVHEIICDADGRPVDYRFLDVNPAFEMMTGLAAQGAVGKTAREVIPGLEEHWISSYGHVALTGQPIRFENHAESLGRWYEVVAFSPARGRFATIFMDITERHEHEEAMRQAASALVRSEATYRAIAHNFPDGAVFIFDHDLRFLVADGEMLPVLGWSRERMEGQTIWDALPAEEARILEQRYRRVLAGESLRFDTPFHGRTLSDHCVPIFDEQGRVLVGMVVTQDITEQKRVEHELQMAAEWLEQRVQERTAELTAANARLWQREARLQVQATLLENANQIDLAILAARAPAEIAQIAIEKVQQSTGSLRAAVTLFDFATETAEVLAAAGAELDPLPVGSRWPLSAEWRLEEVKAGRVAEVRDVTDMRDGDPFKTVHLDHGIHSTTMIPMVAGDQVIGQVTIHRAEPGPLPPEDMELVRHVADSLAVALYNAGLAQQVRSGHEQLRTLSRRLVEVQERERRFVADHLYNQTGQVLAAAKLHLGTLRHAVIDDANASTSLAESQAMLDTVIHQLHDLATGLRPASLDRLGLVPALEQYVAAFGTQHGLSTCLGAADFDGVRVPQHVETALYRIVQEALANVAAHAQAHCADVLLKRQPEGLTLIVEDDGRGFDLSAVDLEAAPGLVEMRERVANLGGQLTIETRPGAGTAVIVEVPL